MAKRPNCKLLKLHEKYYNIFPPTFNVFYVLFKFYTFPWYKYIIIILSMWNHSSQKARVNNSKCCRMWREGGVLCSPLFSPPSTASMYLWRSFGRWSSSGRISPASCTPYGRQQSGEGSVFVVALKAGFAFMKGRENPWRDIHTCMFTCRHMHTYTAHVSCKTTCAQTHERQRSAGKRDEEDRDRETETESDSEIEI